MIETATYVSEACRLYVLFVLLAAVAGKAAAMGDFRETVAELFHLPERGARGAAFGVVGAEGLIALALAAGGHWARTGMAAAMALFMVFGAVILGALVQRRAIICNCFGGRGHVISIHDLLRNLALVAACSFWLLSVPAGASLDPVAWLLLSGIALIAFLVSTHLNEIASLSRRA